MESVQKKSWAEAFGVYLHPRVAGMLFLGFSAGLPLLLVFGTLSFWLAEAGVQRATIGYLSWVGLAYGFKWAWSPLVDRVPLPILTQRLGRRRSWLLLAQVLIAVGLFGMSQVDPATQLPVLVALAILVAFASATQDIALDAYRIEAVDIERQGAMSATYQAGYRLAMISAGAGVLWIAAAFDSSEETYELYPWTVAYGSMAALMLVGIVTTLIIQEPDVPQQKIFKTTDGSWLQRSGLFLKQAIADPFLDFVNRYKWQALTLLALIAVYRVSDVVMGVMSNVFYKEMGFTKDEVATVSKVYGVVMTIVGAAVGGLLVAKMGVLRTLFLGALLSALTNLLFVWVASRGHDLQALVLTVSADNLSSGIASGAFIAFLSALTNRSFTATQYAILTSLMLLLPKFVAGFSGQFVDTYSWPTFFTTTAALGVPAMLLVIAAGRIPGLLPTNDKK